MISVKNLSRRKALLLLLACVAAWVTWIAVTVYLRHSALPVLTASRGGEWIVYPKATELSRQKACPISATFRCNFLVTSRPQSAGLTIRTFRDGAVFINGQPILETIDSSLSWKVPRSRDVAAFLRLGTNEIVVSVTNSIGQPALWLRLEAESLHLSSGEGWLVSLAGSAWQPGRLASRAPGSGPDNPINQSESIAESIGRIWPRASAYIFAVILTVSAAISLIRPTQRELSRVKSGEVDAPRGSFCRAEAGILLAFAFVIAIRATLFFHNLSLVPKDLGFDAEAHEDYVKFILDRHALPLPKDGWEMYQAPLYYLVGSLWLETLGYSATNGDPTKHLRVINGVVGLIQCWLGLLCLRRLFPADKSAQIVGLLLVAFLPPGLYLSQYVTNEPMAGLLVAAAFYFYLRTLQAETIWPYIGAGACLGLALLTKVSALIGAAILGAALVWQCLYREAKSSSLRSPRNPWMAIGGVFLPLLLICGWYYARVWANTGRPMVGNWEADSASAWWQDPGFRPRAFYFHMGGVFMRPLFSSTTSFADGFYSTLWGDGLASGAGRVSTRPPWDYDFMNLLYIVSIIPSLLFLAGLIVAICKPAYASKSFPCATVGRSYHSSVTSTLAAPPRCVWLVTACIVVISALAVIYMSLVIPWYGQVKAFYAFPALVPFAAITALGWNQVVSRCNNLLRFSLGGTLLLWALTAFTAFWIQPKTVETCLSHGLYLADHGDCDAAAHEIIKALELDEVARSTGRKPLLPTTRAEAKCRLAAILEAKGNLVEAIRYYRDALKEQPDFPGALNNLAWILATSARSSVRNGPEAVQLAERACLITHDEVPGYVGTLAAAYAEANRFDQATSTAEKACKLARLRSDLDLERNNEVLLQLYRTGRPFHTKGQ